MAVVVPEAASVAPEVALVVPEAALVVLEVVPEVASAAVAVLEVADSKRLIYPAHTLLPAISRCWREDGYIYTQEGLLKSCLFFLFYFV